LKGLEVSVVSWSHAKASAETVRFDPEYFQKQNLEDELLMASEPNRYISFDDLGIKIDASAFYPSIEEYYGSGDLPFLRVSDVDTFIDFDGSIRIPSELCTRYSTLQRVDKGDIILTKGGSIARVGLITQISAVSRDLIFLNTSRLDELNIIFLYLYFQTAFFNRILLRSSSQTAQPHLTITLVRKLKIVVVGEALKTKCTAIVKQAFAQREYVINQSKRAEQMLLKVLGLEGWQPPEPLTYVRRASDAFVAERLDAEHFQPKFDNLIEAIQTRKIPLDRLGNIIMPIKNGYDFRDFMDIGTPYIRVGDIKNYRIDIEGAARIPINTKDIGKDISLQVSDVLFTRKGSFGNAAPVREGEQHSVISSEIMLIRRKKDHEQYILPEFLALFFNSIVGNYQAEKWAHGAAFYSISQDDLNKFLVPILSLEDQSRIKETVNNAELARRNANHLLEHAKRAVEIAIEQGETAALEYLNETGD
jgi:type I restriction enzyme, S subunit